ncbi:MAG TPA: hypothetical protein VM241_05105 [Candidatus Thermoplasmatota archaeon]|nr:hypothetical protein [Candidatus Thermoplasmatota archaeon]
MKARAVLRVRCRDSVEAEQARRSLAADGDGHASLRVEGAVLVVEATSASALGLLRTLDDLLGCLRAAEPDL